MRTLDARKAFILQAVVQDYVATAEPVGSEAVVSRYRLRISSATVRNEMAEMAEMGYLRQPHTSAGRIPSDLGYRYYVEHLMKPVPITQLLRPKQASLFSPSNPEAGEVERLLQMTCRLLAECTRYASVATAPETDVVSIRQILLSQPAVARLLLVVVASSGQVEHRLVALPEQVSEAQLHILDRVLQQHYQGKELRDLIGSPPPALPAELPVPEVVWQRVLQAVHDCLESLSAQQVFVEGIPHMLEQPEFRQAERLQPVFALLERPQTILRLLRRAKGAHRVHIIIGEENPYPEMRGFSVVASTYRIGNRVAGALSVVGPTRMHYEVATSAVEYVANALSGVLTTLSVNS